MAKETELEKTDRSAKEITFIPMGDKGEITLTIGTVRNFIAAKTKGGNTPTDQDIVKFMMLCQARQLNPWVGDAYLTGYDTKDGPSFSLITAKQALDKRAELHPDYDGMESGVILEIKGELEYRVGALGKKDEIIGAWAKVYRKDVSRPYYHDVSFKVYDTGRSRWAKDPNGMIVKVAEAGALRKAFPSQIGGLYLAEEHDSREKNITPPSEELKEKARKSFLTPKAEATEVEVLTDLRASSSSAKTEETKPESQSSAKQPELLDKEVEWDGANPTPTGDDLKQLLGEIHLRIAETDGINHRAYYAELRTRGIIEDGQNIGDVSSERYADALKCLDYMTSEL